METHVFQIMTVLGVLGLMVPGARVEWMHDNRPVAAHQVVEDLVAADVVLVGEQHGHAPSHATELALLKAIDEATDRPIVLSLEMFERDVAPVLSRYLNDELSEAAFKEQSRPWPNYQTDYRPLVQYAKEHGIGVLAANVPRRIASRVAQDGLAALDELPESDRPFFTPPTDCPRGRPWDKFQVVMQEHPHGDPWKQYEAQCLKDSTMARSISQLYDQRHPGLLVYHVQGAFHGEERYGVPWHLERTHPMLATRVVGLMPVDGRGQLPATGHLGDFVALVAAP